MTESDETIACSACGTEHNPRREPCPECRQDNILRVYDEDEDEEDDYGPRIVAFGDARGSFGIMDVSNNEAMIETDSPVDLSKKR